MEDITSNININDIFSNTNKKSEEEFIPRKDSKKININEINIKKPDNIEGKNNETKRPLIKKEKNENIIDTRKTVNEIKKKKDIIHDDNSFIRRICKEFNGRNSLIKKTFSMPDLEHENLLEEKRKTISRPTININDFIFKDDKELINTDSLCILDNLPEIDEDFNDRFSVMNINKIIAQNMNDKIEDKNEEKNNEIKIPRIARSRSCKIEKEITSDFYEENEHKNKNIIFYKNNINKIKCISFNLLLKKNNF